MSAAGMILDGKATAAEIRAEVAAGVRELVAAGGRQPGLAVVLVGDNPASKVYVASKTRACEEVGMLGRTVRLPATATAAELEAAVDALNADDAIDGFLVQLPLPDGLPERAILERIDPDKDADGFHPVNVGRLWTGEPGFVPATPSGIVELLRRHRVELKGAHAVVVGRSNIVGKPMAALLLREHAHGDGVPLAHPRPAGGVRRGGPAGGGDRPGGDDRSRARPRGGGGGGRGDEPGGGSRRGGAPVPGRRPPVGRLRRQGLDPGRRRRLHPRAGRRRRRSPRCPAGSAR